MAGQYASTVSLGMDILSGISNWTVASAKADAARILEQSNAEVQNMYRQGENRKAAAQASLDAYTRSVNNKRVLEYAGSQYNTMSTNLLRLQDAASHGSFSMRLRAAAEAGALAGEQAFQGVGGATTVRVANTLRAQQNLQLAEQAKQVDMQTYDANKQRAELQSSMYLATDLRYSMANLDYNKNVPRTVFSPSLLGAVVGSIDPAKLKESINEFNPRPLAAPVVEGNFFNYGGPALKY